MKRHLLLVKAVSVVGWVLCLWPFSGFSGG
jgi:hypothetical protein